MLRGRRATLAQMLEWSEMRTIAGEHVPAASFTLPDIVETFDGVTFDDGSAIVCASVVGTFGSADTTPADPPQVAFFILEDDAPPPQKQLELPIRSDPRTIRLPIPRDASDPYYADVNAHPCPKCGVAAGVPCLDEMLEQTRLFPHAARYKA